MSVILFYLTGMPVRNYRPFRKHFFWIGFCFNWSFLHLFDHESDWIGPRTSNVGLVQNNRTN